MLTAGRYYRVGSCTRPAVNTFFVRLGGGDRLSNGYSRETGGTGGP